jgi:hypothetical protein
MVAITVGLANFQWECLWWDIVVANENEFSERDRGLGGSDRNWSRCGGSRCDRNWSRCGGVGIVTIVG